MERRNDYKNDKLDSVHKQNHRLDEAEDRRCDIEKMKDQRAKYLIKRRK